MALMDKTDVALVPQMIPIWVPTCSVERVCEGYVGGCTIGARAAEACAPHGGAGSWGRCAGRWRSEAAL